VLVRPAWERFLCIGHLRASTILEMKLSECACGRRQTGFGSGLSPIAALAAHLGDFIEAQELDSSATLLDRLRSPEQDPSTLPSLLDGMVSANTGFFRHPGALNALDAAGAAGNFGRESRRIVLDPSASGAPGARRERKRTPLR